MVNIYISKYFFNNNRDDKVNIYRFSKKHLKIKSYIVFLPKERHVHGTYKDPFTKYFYVLTGICQMSVAYIFLKISSNI